jgi:hypothetical protein
MLRSYAPAPLLLVLGGLFSVLVAHRGRYESGILHDMDWFGTYRAMGGRRGMIRFGWTWFVVGTLLILVGIT